MKGFTIIEMLIVLTIIGIITAGLAPSFAPQLERAKLQSCLRDISSGLRQARGLAQISGREVVFSINLNTKTYTFSNAAKTFKLPKEFSFSIFTVSNEILNSDNGGVRFYPDGSSSGGRIQVQTSNISLLIDVNWLTGKVTIHPKNEHDK